MVRNGFRRKHLAAGLAAALGGCEAANDALEDDLSVSERDGHPEKLRPFTRGELLKPLERWFFGR